MQHMAERPAKRTGAGCAPDKGPLLCRWLAPSTVPLLVSLLYRLLV